MNVTLQHGRAYMSDIELDLLAHTVAVPGDHLEIGSMWGGTAITAATAKQHAGVPGQVVCIDPFLEADYDNGHRPTPTLFWENMTRAGVQDRVELHQCLSAPYPLSMKRRFATVLIDGNHKAPWPETDWETARCVTDTIMLHDVNWHEPDVARLHERVTADGWAVRAMAHFLYVYDRQ